jgi:hypothetical protein
LDHDVALWTQPTPDDKQGTMASSAVAPFNLYRNPQKQFCSRC